MTTYTYRTASASVNCEGRIGLTTVSGLITTGLLRGLVADTAAWGVIAPLAGLIDIRGAVLGVLPDDMLRAAVGVGRSRADAPPTAFVVGPGQIHLLRDYAEAMRALGALKGVFSCQVEARAWVDQQALVMGHRLARRALRSAAP